MVRDVSDYAKYDPAFACDGLFVPRAKKGQALYDVGKTYDRGEIRFKGEQLTAAHQSVLLAVCARTGRNGLIVPTRLPEKNAAASKLSAPPQDDFEAMLDEMLASLFDGVSGGAAAEQSVAHVEVAPASLLRDADLSLGGNGRARLVQLLHGLSSTTIYRCVGSQGGISRILTFKHKDDHIQIMLNWRLAAAILGGVQFARISLYERNDLRSPVSKILHAWICCHVRNGSQLANGRGVRLDTLIPHVWGRRPYTDTEYWRRRSELKKALDEIAALGGWDVAPGRRPDLWQISRPRDLYAHEPVEKWLPSPGVYYDEVERPKLIELENSGDSSAGEWGL